MSILGTALPAAQTLVTLYQVPAGRRAVVNVAACNRGPLASTLRLALSSNTSPADSEYIEFDVSLAPSEVLERTALSLAAGQQVLVQADSDHISFNTWGIEEVA